VGASVGAAVGAGVAVGASVGAAVGASVGAGVAARHAAAIAAVAASALPFKKERLLSTSPLIFASLITKDLQRQASNQRGPFTASDFRPLISERRGRQHRAGHPPQS